MDFLLIDRNATEYFDSFVMKYILQELLSKIENKSITHNILSMQDDNYIICKFHCIAFMECMFKQKKLLDYNNLVPANGYKGRAR